MQESLKENKRNIPFWPVMIAIFFGSFLAILGISTINVAIPVLMTEFNADLGSVQWTMTGFVLATGIVAPITGYLGDRFSTKKIYVGALIGFTLSSIICALAWNIHSLIFFRIIQGIFCGIIMPVTMTIIYQVISSEKQAYALSLWTLSSMLAPAIGPSLAGFLIELLSWKWLFLMNIPFGIVGAAAALKYIPFYKIDQLKKFDLMGLVTVVISSTALLIVFSEGHNWGWLSWKSLLLLFTGITTLILFIKRETNVDTPLLNLKVFRHPEYTYSLILLCIITISLYSGTYLAPVFLQNIQGASALEAGLVLLPASLVMALFMPITGKLYDRIGPIWLILVGVLFIAVGTWAMGNLTVKTSHGYIMFWMTIRNIGISLSMMPATNVGMAIIPRELSGHASSVSNWTRQGLGSFSIGLFTALLAVRLVGHTNELSTQNGIDSVKLQQEAFTLSINDVFIAATLVMLVCIPVVFLLKNKLQKSARSIVLKKSS
jgi:EmrB/QacA subfamily drug resistance transporter